LTERLPLGPFSPKQAAATADEVMSLGVSLGPALHEACGGRLGHIEWFSSPWQRSGAATGRTHWRLPSGLMVPAIVKAPVGYREYFWTTRLGATDPMRYDASEASHLPVPRVFQSGIELGGYDVAWLVVERVPGKPLTHRPSRKQMELLFEAAARFHQMAAEVQAISLGRPEDEPDWSRLLDRAAVNAEANVLCPSDRWRRAIDATREHLGELREQWGARPIDTWCHGDLHPGNAMVRNAAEHADGTLEGGGPDPCGVLIDLALVRTGSWFEDALYVERVHWGYEHLLAGIDPVAALAEARRAVGLSAPNGDCDRAMRARRVLNAAISPAFADRADDPHYLGGCLVRIEHGLDLRPD